MRRRKPTQPETVQVETETKPTKPKKLKTPKYKSDLLGAPLRRVVVLGSYKSDKGAETGYQTAVEKIGHVVGVRLYDDSKVLIDLVKVTTTRPVNRQVKVMGEGYIVRGTKIIPFDQLTPVETRHSYLRRLELIAQVYGVTYLGYKGSVSTSDKPLFDQLVSEGVLVNPEGDLYGLGDPDKIRSLYPEVSIVTETNLTLSPDAI